MISLLLRRCKIIVRVLDIELKAAKTVDGETAAACLKGLRIEQRAHGEAHRVLLTLVSEGLLKLFCGLVT